MDHLAFFFTKNNLIIKNYSYYDFYLLSLLPVPSWEGSRVSGSHGSLSLFDTQAWISLMILRNLEILIGTNPLGHNYCISCQKLVYYETKREESDNVKSKRMIWVIESTCEKVTCFYIGSLFFKKLVPFLVPLRDFFREGLDLSSLRLFCA